MRYCENDRFLRGQVVHLESEYIVLDVQGVGYRVFCPNPYAFAKTDGTITVFTHHHVREDAILLFGFPTREEQKLFRKLIEVSGIGPRVALGILGGDLRTMWFPRSTKRMYPS